MIIAHYGEILYLSLGGHLRFAAVRGQTAVAVCCVLQTLARLFASPWQEQLEAMVDKRPSLSSVRLALFPAVVEK